MEKEWKLYKPTVQENKMRKIVSEGISLNGVLDAQPMGQWPAAYFSEERHQFNRAGVFEP